MALSDKNILITPNTGQTADPTMVFSGADSTTGAQDITLKVYPTSNGTLSFEGSAGQLFSITNNLTSGSIFSVNDVSGLPAIDVNANGNMSLLPYGGGGVGIGTLNPSTELEISATAPVFELTSTTSITDEKRWGQSVSGGDFYIYPINDASTASGYAYNIVRNGMNMTQHNWYVGTGVGEAAQRRMMLTVDGLDVLNDTSGYGAVAAEQTFRLSAAGTAITTIANFFGATSAVSLEAASSYEFTAYCRFLKTTASTVTWTLTASSAPTQVSARFIQTPITGTGGVGVIGTITSAATAATAFAVTGSLSTGVQHFFEIKAYINTNAACNLRLNLACTSGSATPQAGSFYTVKKIGANTGTFVA